MHLLHSRIVVGGLLLSLPSFAGGDDPNQISPTLPFVMQVTPAANKIAAELASAHQNLANLAAVSRDCHQALQPVLNQLRSPRSSSDSSFPAAQTTTQPRPTKSLEEFLVHDSATEGTSVTVKVEDWQELQFLIDNPVTSTISDLTIEATIPDDELLNVHWDKLPTTWSKLKSFNLNIPNFGARNMHKLAPHLKKMTQLESLSLKGAGLEPGGAGFLHRALSHLVNLQALDLQGCEIGDSGFANLIPIIESLPKLKALNIKGNNLTRRSVGRFLATLRIHPGWESLIFGDVTLDVTKEYSDLALKKEVLPLYLAAFMDSPGLIHFQMGPYTFHSFRKDPNSLVGAWLDFIEQAQLPRIAIPTAEKALQIAGAKLSWKQSQIKKMDPNKLDSYSTYYPIAASEYHRLLEENVSNTNRPVQSGGDTYQLEQQMIDQAIRESQGEMDSTPNFVIENDDGVLIRDPKDSLIEEPFYRSTLQFPKRPTTVEEFKGLDQELRTPSGKPHILVMDLLEAVELFDYSPKSSINELTIHFLNGDLTVEQLTVLPRRKFSGVPIYFTPWND